MAAAVDRRPRGGVANPLVDVEAFGTQYPAMYGGQAPALIWQRFMAAAHADKPVAAFPPASTGGAAGGPGPQRGGMPLDAAVGTLTAAGFKAAIAPVLLRRPSRCPWVT